MKNDESILKLATSPDMASTSKDNSRMIKSKPTELTEFKDQLSSKQTTLEEKEATLDSTLQDKKLSTIRKSEKVEEIHKSKVELKLALQKSLALTSLERQLETELGELKRTTEQLIAENRHTSEARDAAIMSAKEAEEELAGKTSEERVALFQCNVTQLKTELTAFEYLSTNSRKINPLS